MREGGIGKRDFGNQEGPCECEGIRVGQLEGREGVRHGSGSWSVAHDACVRVRKVVRYVAERGLAAELQVEGAVFDIIKDPETAAHNQLGVAEHVPGKTDSRSKVVLVGINQSFVGSTGIARIQNIGRSVWKHGGLLSGEEAENIVVNVALGPEIVPAQAVVQGEVLGELPGVLDVQADSTGADTVSSFGKLEVVVPESSDEISRFVSGEIAEREIITAIVVEIVVEILADAGDVRTEFNLVAGTRPGVIVGPLEGRIVKRGGALRGGT